MKNLMLIFVAAMFAVSANAAGVADDAFMPVTGTTGTTGNASTGQTPFPKYVPPPPPPPAPAPPPQSSSINPAANQGQQSQSGGAGANAAAGAALIAAGMALMSQPPTVPAGAALIAMGMLAMAQSGHDSDAAGQSGATAAASYNALNQTPGKAPEKNPDLGKGKGGYNDPAVKEGMKALNDAGYEITPNGLKAPDGTTIPNSAFNSPGGLAAAGLNADNVKAVGDALGTVNKDTMGNAPKISSVATADGAGGGGGESSSKTNPDFSFGTKSKWGMNAADKAAMIAGKTVNFDGEPIGVRGNNIFDMVHVAYQKKRDANDFLEEAGAAKGGPALRAPASAVPYSKQEAYDQPKSAGPRRAVINNR